MKKSLMLLALFWGVCGCRILLALPVYYDRSTWPDQIKSHIDFDRASMLEIYSFSVQLDQADLLDIDFVKKVTGIENPNMASVQVWQQRIQKQLMRNFLFACKGSQWVESKHCLKIDSISSLIALGQRVFDQEKNKYYKWFNAAGDFHRGYLYQQLRLASLFPRITSEIDKLSKSEVNGFEIPDKQFLLSFDDGPTLPLKKTTTNRLTAEKIITERVVSILNNYSVSSYFFVLGERYQKLSAEYAKRLYASHCVYSHGTLHKSHARISGWAQSIDESFKLLESSNTEGVSSFARDFSADEKIGKTSEVRTKQNWFRPPYGERTIEMIEYLENKYSARVMLWNIDSRDWHSKMTAKNVSDRTISLMLIWRRGILLFHDTQEKTPEALAYLLEWQKATGLQFLDCEYANTLL